MGIIQFGKYVLALFDPSKANEIDGIENLIESRNNTINGLESQIDHYRSLLHTYDRHTGEPIDNDDYNGRIEGLEETIAHLHYLNLQDRIVTIPNVVSR
jgi:hypothetical protein